MILIKGATAFSTFRMKKLVSQLQERIPTLSSIQAEIIYFVETDRHLLIEEEDTLMLLLGGVCQVPQLEKEQVIIVMPRFGTISPWSSKATDILHNCGLHAVLRVERGVRYFIESTHSQTLTDSELQLVYPLIHDPMTQSIGSSLQDAEQLFVCREAANVSRIDILGEGLVALEEVNEQLQLGLSRADIDYLCENFLTIGRNPTHTELMMYAQANSEHCRHKIFNATWVIDGETQSLTLFDMIRNTYQPYSENILSAYKDNAAVITGSQGQRLLRDYVSGEYLYHEEDIDIVMKVETHNHPTAISPYPGAATGAGGEIRDEGATGLGAKPKAGLTGFALSDLMIPGLKQPWERQMGKPGHIASALDIILDAPIGAANYNNEFGRPNLCGYFRTFQMQLTINDTPMYYGYHKPIMLAGGLGNIRREHVKKKGLVAGVQIVVIGGPAMQIGLGGGSASSMQMQTGHEARDYASVQRDNAEMQRRCQDLIDACYAFGENNPIQSIHDVGAGGLSNAIPEIIHDSEMGGRFELRAIPSADQSLSPLAIWCNEAQERYVIAVAPNDLEQFKILAERERCPYALVGEVTDEETLIVGDSYFESVPIDIQMNILFGNTPKLIKRVERTTRELKPLDLSDVSLIDVAYSILQLPTVGDKSYLIHIGDRSVGGLVARDQMVGPWQIPVADCAVTMSGYQSQTGEAMALGERSPIAVIDPVASARMAVAEAITNIAAADIEKLTDIKLSANWMAAASHALEQQALYDAVCAIGLDFCPQLGLTIPVGKDSLSMQCQWQLESQSISMQAPLSLNVTAVAPVHNVDKTLTPCCQHLHDTVDTDLLFIDLARGQQRLGGSALAYVCDQMGNSAPDVEDIKDLHHYFQALQMLKANNQILAYHDRSDGGLFVTLCEIAFASRCGLSVLLDDLGPEPLTALFNEELGAVIQIRHKDLSAVMQIFETFELAPWVYVIGCPTTEQTLTIHHAGINVFSESRAKLQKNWSRVSYEICKLRDNPACAEQAYKNIEDDKDRGLNAKLSFDIEARVSAPYINRSIKPQVAILREQGINGHFEMAAAFQQAGFVTHDVHMTDILTGQEGLVDFVGLAVCGGFSYGDVLGAGRGWAASIQFHERAQTTFSRFFERDNTFTLGVCNGCQMLSQLRHLIPGSEHWPEFISNRSERFEARLSLVKIKQSRSVLLSGMQDSILPIVVAHGEGRVNWLHKEDELYSREHHLTLMQYVNHDHKPTAVYPFNPNGSMEGVTGFCNEDGRVTIMMPHPERVFLSRQLSWHPSEWPIESPWLRLFENARVFVG